MHLLYTIYAGKEWMLLGGELMTGREAVGAIILLDWMRHAVRGGKRPQYFLK